MIDLETLGNKPGAVIVAIGAVEFGDGQIKREFYRRIDPQSCVDVGLTMDVSTVLWWLTQNEAARNEIAKPGGDSLNRALMDFRAFVLDDGNALVNSVEVWGNGAAFDNVVLAAAFDACQIFRPWKFWNDRCYRTLKAMFPEIAPTELGGVAHHALHDAKKQALHLMRIFDAMCGHPMPIP